MGTKRNQNKDKKRQIKKYIATKLTLSGTCLILSTTATISHGTHIEANVAKEAEITERLKAVRSLSQTREGRQAQENAEGRENTQKTAWTNWDDWTKN